MLVATLSGLVHVVSQQLISIWGVIALVLGIVGFLMIRRRDVNGGRGRARPDDLWK